MYHSYEHALLWSVQPLCYLPLPSQSPLFNSFQYYISWCPLPADVKYFNIVTIILFPFPPPKFHRVVPVSQTSSTYKFVHDHVCFCVYIYLLDL
jgi:hypothetical protein